MKRPTGILAPPMDDFGGMGFRRELPDFGDSAFDDHDVQAQLRVSSPFRATASGPLPASADLRKWCSRVRDQGSAPTACAHAVAGLVEYFQLRGHGEKMQLSTRFLDKVTRDLTASGEGPGLRATLKTLALVGAPPEALWPYDAAKIDEAPPPYCYAFSERFRGARYFRLDPANATGDNILTYVKRCLASRLPSVFGLPVYGTMPRIGDGTTDIFFPERGQALVGGHALLAVGYDDEQLVGHEHGALIVRGSWGTAWGDKGYAYLPYKWVSARLAVDFWTFVRPDFVNTDLFN